MTYLFNKVKLVATGILAFSFFMTMTLSSCNMKSQDSDDTDEATEQAEGTNENPSGEDENASGEEHPAGGDEHPSDSTSTEGGEHPTDS